MKEWQKVTLTQFGLKNNDILSDICDGGDVIFSLFRMGILGWQ
jgi:hypothetical protein